MDDHSAGAADRLERERRFHDERFTDDSARAAAGKFYELVGAATAHYDRVLDAAVPGSMALEYGSGEGGTAGLRLGGRGVRVRGIDISPVAVEQANAAARDIGLSDDLAHYEVMDAEHLSFDDDTFALVFGSGILHHLDLAAAFAEVARVLHPDGVAVFFEPMGHNPAINAYRRLTPKMRSPDEHPLVTADLALARRCFGDVAVEVHVLSAFAALAFRRSRRYPAVIERLTKVDAALFRRVPWAQRFGWIVVLELRKPVA